MQTRAQFLAPALAAPILAAVLATGAVAAETSRLAPAFGNTVVTTYPDGRQQQIWLRADGTWEGISRKRSPLAGTWKVQGEKLCMKQVKPPTLPVSYCTAFPHEARPGVVWTSKDMGGTPIQLKLVRGMAQVAGGAPTP